MIQSQKVIIKGTKDGLLLQLDDACSFPELLKELEDKLLPHYKKDKDNALYLSIHTGNRLLSDEQINEIRETIPRENLRIKSIDSNVILKDEAKELYKDDEIHMITRIIRSGQVLQVSGDLILIGDVNPGAKVMASGNIYILGTLKGIAHAGCEGNDEAIICASNMIPTQLWIADYFRRAPDRDEEKPRDTISQCAYISPDKEILIDRIVVLNKIRPNLNRFVEGGNESWERRLL